MADYKDLITKLQLATPIAVPVAVYPEREGKYEGSDYYCAASSEVKIRFLIEYLPVLADWKRIVIQSRQNYKLRDLSYRICQGKLTKYDKIKAVHDWVYFNIDYQQTATLVPPDRLVSERRGDCKSFTVLISTLLGIQEIPTWFKLVQLYDDIPRHIYNFAAGTWYPVDGTGYFAFEEVKRVIGYMLFEVDSTITSPPRPAPSSVSAEEYPPPVILETIGEFSPIIALGLLLAISKIRR